ncbi:hypothetical protein H9L21_14935 [Aeromicrobium senzhongii]|uniref:Lipoprotein n=1 Tax=Aeromicrobium senzhongii TaxID=2663859 RepID=A0ABX6SSH4_9ACTN|nr:hypothetical protein [Aeromicrobium senzhongii]MTB89518.1 hypothetical protein [Aeromicrobium senzhongii]QNL94349.1 hypothetical protein H9L21_14935 [Aeromicrobium senzhongii]
MFRRFLVALGAAVLLATLLSACDSGNERDGLEVESTESVEAATPSGLITARADDVAAVSRFLLESASAVVLVTEQDRAAALDRARDLGVPALPDTDAGRAEAERLGARVLDADDEARDPAKPIERSTPVTIATATEPSRELLDLVTLGGGELARIARDPRRHGPSAKLLRREPDAPLLTLGASPYAVRVVRADAQTVGGGWFATRGKHLVAMYGHPSGPALGVLGEQGAEESIARVRRLVDRYEQVDPDATFVPAFEIITTVASAAKGPRGDYSARTRVAELQPLVDAAERAGVAVILDLQPGRSSFLSQAREYESLLRRPHVGLALDPEWRLGPKDKPLQRIGHVGVGEVNRVSAWLAALTRKHALPQKVFVLHQFQTQMIRDRERVRTDHPELATVIHVDGQGSPGAKFGTWRTIRAGAPEGVGWGWKNFVDEDEPMLSVAQTWAQVRPRPQLITYQ